MLPSSSFDMCNLAVSVMTKWGGIVMLPYDLRLPFARFLAHNPFITQLKRYSIERVYRERRVLGHHPRELYECAFDIVTPNLGNMVAESELLSFVWQVLNQFPSLLENNCLIRLNHTSLIEAIFLHCDIDQKKFNKISGILAQAKEDNYTQAQLESALIEIDLTKHTICTMMSLLDLENSFGLMFTTLHSIFKRSTSTMTLFKQAFHQLEMVINNVTELGVKCPITVSLGSLENISYYSGMICQFVWEQRNKHGRNQRHIFASGGRYDKLIAELRHVHGGQCHANDVMQTAVGITISMDKLVSTLQAQKFKISPIDVVVCSLGTKLMTREKLNLTRDLWAAGVKTYVFDSLQNLEEIQNICFEMNIFHIVLLKDTDPGCVRIRSWIKDRFQEKKVLMDECVDYVLRLCQLDDSIISPKTENKCTEMPVINVVFYIGQKLSSAMKRRYESQVYNSLLNTTKRLSAKVRVEVIVVNLEADILKMLAAYIDLNSEDQDWSVVVKRYPKHKKTIYHISEHIQDMKTNVVMATVVLFSIVDNTFKVVL